MWQSLARPARGHRGLNKSKDRSLNNRFPCMAKAPNRGDHHQGRGALRWPRGGTNISAPQGPRGGVALCRVAPPRRHGQHALTTLRETIETNTSSKSDVARAATADAECGSPGKTAARQELVHHCTNTSRAVARRIRSCAKSRVESPRHCSKISSGAILYVGILRRGKVGKGLDGGTKGRHTTGNGASRRCLCLAPCGRSHARRGRSAQAGGLAFRAFASEEVGPGWWSTSPSLHGAHKGVLVSGDVSAPTAHCMEGTRPHGRLGACVQDVGLYCLLTSPSNKVDPK